MAAAAAALSLLNRRLRTFRKRRSRISQFEERLARGESLNADQLEVLRSKAVVLAVIDEFENLRASFEALQEDISGGSSGGSTAIAQVQDSESPIPAVVAAAAADSPKEVEVFQKTPDESQHPQLAPDQPMADENPQRAPEQAVDEPPESDEPCLVDSKGDIASVEQEQKKSEGDLEEEQQDTEEEGQWMSVQRKAFQNLKVRDPYWFGDYRGYRRSGRGGRGQADGHVYQQGRRGGVYLNGQGQGVGHVQQGGREGVYLNGRGQGVGPMHQQGGRGGVYLNGRGQGVGLMHQQGGSGGGYLNGRGQGVGPVHQQGGGRGGVYQNGPGQGGMTRYENNRGRGGMNGGRGEGVAYENGRGRGGMVGGRAGGMVYENGRGRGGMNGYMIGRGGRDFQNGQGQYSRGQEGGRPHAAQIVPVQANGQQV